MYTLNECIKAWLKGFFKILTGRGYFDPSLMERVKVVIKKMADITNIYLKDLELLRRYFKLLHSYFSAAFYRF